jgi:hypothetical protein
VHSCDNTRAKCVCEINSHYSSTPSTTPAAQQSGGGGGGGMSGGGVFALVFFIGLLCAVAGYAAGRPEQVATLVGWVKAAMPGQRARMSPTMGGATGTAGLAAHDSCSATPYQAPITIPTITTTN